MDQVTEEIVELSLDELEQVGGGLSQMDPVGF
jgi:hypothetical protein